MASSSSGTWIVVSSASAHLYDSYNVPRKRRLPGTVPGPARSFSAEPPPFEAFVPVGSFDVVAVALFLPPGFRYTMCRDFTQPGFTPARHFNTMSTFRNMGDRGVGN